MVLSTSAPKIWKILPREVLFALGLHSPYKQFFKENEEHTIVSKNTEKQDCEVGGRVALGRVSWRGLNFREGPGANEPCLGQV